MPDRRRSSRRSTGCTRGLALISGCLPATGGRSRRPEVPCPLRPARRESGGWIYGRGGPAWAIRLPDERWIVAKPPPRQRRPVAGIIAFLGVIALVVAICAYPLVRRLTRRLERLQAGVESLGAGELSARVKVEGKDEVARLAESFNSSAARIEELVSAHKMLLANTSHELRTPLSRIRLGIELMKDSADPGRKAALEKDIAELDGLIEQILLSSRLDATKGVEAPEDIDLLALAAEEAARYEHCSVTGMSRCRHGQSCPAAADGAQSARQCRAARCAADRGRCAASGRQGRDQRRRSWCRS